MQEEFLRALEIYDKIKRVDDYDIWLWCRQEFDKLSKKLLEDQQLPIQLKRMLKIRRKKLNL